MPNPKTAELIAEAMKPLADQIQGLQRQVEEIKVQKLPERVLDVKPTPKIEPILVGETPIDPELVAEPMSPEIRQLVDTILNPEFPVVIDSRQTPGAFGFNVFVPKKYSNAPQSHWDTYKFDKRFKAIPREQGLDGIRSYLNQVLNNLTQDARTQIVIDRNGTAKY